MIFFKLSSSLNTRNLFFVECESEWTCMYECVWCVFVWMFVAVCVKCVACVFMCICGVCACEYLCVFVYMCDVCVVCVSVFVCMV